MKYCLLFVILFLNQTFAQPNGAISPALSFIAQNINSAADMEESCHSFLACNFMNHHSKTYILKGNANENFKKLLALSPQQIWDNLAQFRSVYDHVTTHFLGIDEPLPPVALGQVYFLDLSILNVLKIPVAFKIIELDMVNNVLSFSYLKKNKSQGVQRISFKDQDGQTAVVHESRFKSSSKMRDALLYRHIHTLLLNDFYERLQLKI